MKLRKLTGTMADIPISASLAETTARIEWGNNVLYLVVTNVCTKDITPAVAQQFELTDWIGRVEAYTGTCIKPGEVQRARLNGIAISKELGDAIWREKWKEQTIQQRPQ